ncbi:hypothetical protein IscW_ISCW009198 [Ixodes scapularis]|uniref:Uncharacterized protein n=1 Tax=Ixodes scapularis TaxID=6945 RepID=B7Q016_IXOSC|nr:hypothetical protein IscW_ISCW009198 [Ixodes scapularis]|eukprot:XP_002406728.1 hypothetical protein IscW_ISCW009198 [Ixodes scapularis]
MERCVPWKQLAVRAISKGQEANRRLILKFATRLTRSTPELRITMVDHTCTQQHRGFNGRPIKPGGSKRFTAAADDTTTGGSRPAAMQSLKDISHDVAEE